MSKIGSNTGSYIGSNTGSYIGSNTGSYIGSSIIGCSAWSIRSSIGSSIRIAKGVI